MSKIRFSDSSEIAQKRDTIEQLLIEAKNSPEIKQKYISLPEPNKPFTRVQKASSEAEKIKVKELIKSTFEKTNLK